MTHSQETMSFEVDPQMAQILTTEELVMGYVATILSLQLFCNLILFFKKIFFLKHLWDNTKPSNIHVISGPERKVRENGAEKIFEKLKAKNYQNC